MERVVMRCIAWARIVLFGACMAAAGDAFAGVKVSEKTRGYEIAGRTGAALLAGMDRRGPKHGFLTRAIAQTRYSVSWTIEWGETRTACRVKSIDGKLDIIYTYPSASDLPPGLERRWARFLAGVRKHERMHGDIARRMARAVEKSIAKVSVANDPGCRKARAEAKDRMTAIYADYEARQIKFDAREHREGGRVEGLIGALTGR
jgi:predicted secreted Zn-dependent protease